MLEEIKSVLETDDTFRVFMGELPREEKNAALLYLTGGKNPTRVFGMNEPVVYEPRFNLTVRSSSYERALSYIEGAREKLEGYCGERGVSPIMCVFSESDIKDKGKDERGLNRLEVKFKAVLSQI